MRPPHAPLAEASGASAGRRGAAMGAGAARLLLLALMAALSPGGLSPLSPGGLSPAAAPATTKPGPRCWFLHGAGERCLDADGRTLPPEQCPGPSTTPDMMDGAPYWGDFRPAGGGGVEMPHCASLHYNHEDTVTQKFDAPNLRQRVCRMLCGVPEGRPAAGCVITDAVIFTHSAANNVFASALMHGDCYLGGSSDWFSVNAPALGSKAADFAMSVCSNSVLRNAACAFHYCSDCTKNSGAGANPMYVSMGTHYTNFLPLRDVIREHSSGSMCGTDANGIPCPSGNTHCTGDDVGLCTLAKIAYSTGPLPALDCCSASSTDCRHAGKPGVTESDGMVGWSSCALPGRDYVEDWRTRWYKMQGNHEDGTCANGEGSGDSKQPCKWYQQMAKFAVEGSGPDEPNPLWRSPRPDRYSCGGGGVRGCVRDPNGLHLSETACVAHCQVCVPSPCAHGGSCVAVRNDSWHDAEADGGLPFHCSCIGTWQGERCNTTKPHAAAHGKTSHEKVLVALGGTVAAAVALAAFSACGVAVQQRCERRRAGGQAGAALLGSLQSGGLSGSE
jgi:hypothetical protein